VAVKSIFGGYQVPVEHTATVFKVEVREVIVLSGFTSTYVSKDVTNMIVHLRCNVLWLV
jgi:hypothetical protein